MSAPDRQSVESPRSCEIARLKQVEAQLQRMTRVFMDGADPIVIRDLEGRILDVNCEVQRVFGWTREELIGQRTQHVLPPEWHALADDVLERCQRGEAVRNVEASVRTKSGETVPILTTAFLLTDENDAPVAIANIVKDISRLKETEARLRQRNGEIRQFVGAVSHDLGAPVRAVRSFAEDLQLFEHELPDDRARENVQFILDCAERMQQLLDDLMDYSRLDRAEAPLTSVDCERVLQQALMNLRADILVGEAEVTHDPLPTVPGNASQLVRLFQNLIGNGVKFRGDAPPRVHVSARRDDGLWEFTVSDNGIGIDPRHFEKVFGVFQRLHSQEMFPGNGVGLASCKVIVERHGGRIWVESAPGEGSVFHFTLFAETPMAHEGED